MPTVLLTRPQDGSEELARALKQLHYQTALEPLLTIQPVRSPLPDWQNLQAVMATSAHAFDFLDRAVCETHGFFTRPCVCVGSATAKAARDFGFFQVVDSHGDGLALAQTIRDRFDPEAGGLLDLRGRDADNRGREELQKAGFVLHPWVLYVAEAATDLTPEAVALLRENRCDAVLVFSTRTAETLRNLLLKHSLEASCTNVIALGISDAVLLPLKTLPWRRLEAAPHPSEKAVLQLLQKLLPVPEVP